MITTRRFRAIHARSPFHDVEVELQDPLFAKDNFSDGNESRLGAFAKKRSSCSKQKIFYELLRDSGSAAQAIAFPIFLRSLLEGFPIEAMVRVEVSIFRGDHGMLKIGRNLAKRNKGVLLLIRTFVKPRLYAPLRLNDCCGWIDPSERTE